MNSQSALVLGIIVFSFLFVQVLRWLRVGIGHREVPGAYVAEVWLNWEICRGSTLYRARFHRQWQAALAAKFHAVWLDWVLPTHYRAEYSSGRRYWEPYGFAICFGVRAATSLVQDRATLWSPHLPGSPRSSSEHAASHPWQQDTSVSQGDLTGFKI